MMDLAEPDRYSKEDLEAYRAISISSSDGKTEKLYALLHADARQLCSALQNGTYDIAPDWFNFERLGKLSEKEIGTIGSAFNFIDNRLDPYSPTPPTQEQVQCAFSCVYHVLNDDTDKGQSVKALIKLAAKELGVNLLPHECLKDDDVKDVLGAIIIQQSRGI